MANADSAFVAVAASGDLPEATLVAHVMAQAARPLSQATRERLSHALLDWFTAGWSAIDLPAAATLRGLARELFPGEGPSAIFGGGNGSSDGSNSNGNGGSNADLDHSADDAAGATPMAAAFANAGICHLREIDDAHRAAMLHPGVVAISPVLALAPALGLTHDQVARAIVAGYEVALRVGEAMGAGHAGMFHATATAGSVGAAAAAGMALGLNATQLHHALGIAATQAAGLWQLVDDDAHEAKSLHPAFAVRNGMTAAYAARAGLPGARAFVTGKRGMYAALSGNGPLSALDGDLDAPERIHTATIKAWPACAMLFTPLDATLELIQQHGIAAADVQAVDIAIFPHALKIASVHWPVKASEASFCLRYLIAVLLTKGSVGIADVEAPDVGSAELQALAGRITVRPEEEYQKAFPQKRPSRVSITLRDGREVNAYRVLRRGDPEDPFTWEGLQARLRAFAPAVDAETAQALIDGCLGLSQEALSAQHVRLRKIMFGVADGPSATPELKEQCKNKG